MHVQIVVLIGASGLLTAVLHTISPITVAANIAIVGMPDCRPVSTPHAHLPADSSVQSSNRYDKLLMRRPWLLQVFLCTVVAGMGASAIAFSWVGILMVVLCPSGAAYRLSTDSFSTLQSEAAVSFLQEFLSLCSSSCSASTCADCTYRCREATSGASLSSFPSCWRSPASGSSASS